MASILERNFGTLEILVSLPTFPTVLHHESGCLRTSRLTHKLLTKDQVLSALLFTLFKKPLWMVGSI